VVVAEADGGFGAVEADLVEDGLVALLVPGGAGAEG
jgi:tellurite resistance protein